MTAGVLVSNVGSQAPVPPRRCAAAMAMSASGLGSLLKRWPPPPLTCRSTNAGDAMQSLHQHGAPSARDSVPSALAVIRPFSMRSAMPLRICSPSKSSAGLSHHGEAAGGSARPAVWLSGESVVMYAVCLGSGLHQEHRGAAGSAGIAEAGHGEASLTAGDPAGAVG